MTPDSKKKVFVLYGQTGSGVSIAFLALQRADDIQYHGVRCKCAISPILFQRQSLTVFNVSSFFKRMEADRLFFDRRLNI